MRFRNQHFLRLADVAEGRKFIWDVIVGSKKSAGRVAEIIVCAVLLLILFLAFGYVLSNWPILGSIWLTATGVILLFFRGVGPN